MLKSTYWSRIQIVDPGQENLLNGSDANMSGRMDCTRTQSVLSSLEWNSKWNQESRCDKNNTISFSPRSLVTEPEGNVPACCHGDVIVFLPVMWYVLSGSGRKKILLSFFISCIVKRFWALCTEGTSASPRPYIKVWGSSWKHGFNKALCFSFTHF